MIVQGVSDPGRSKIRVASRASRSCLLSFFDSLSSRDTVLYMRSESINVWSLIVSCRPKYTSVVGYPTQSSQINGLLREDRQSSDNLARPLALI